MLKLQDLTITLHNQSKIEAFLVEHPGSMFRAMLTLPVSSARMVSWHELLQPHKDAAGAFKWVIGHAASFCKRIGTTMDEIVNAAEGEFISGADQLRIVQTEGIAVNIRVNGSVLKNSSPSEIGA